MIDTSRSPPPARPSLAGVLVRPERLAEVEHRELIADGLHRHPTFRGVLAG